MSKIGILAYGSLMDEPGEEIKTHAVKIISVKTPFKVEFARKSKRRSNAPTLIPVNKYGANVNAKIFILQDQISKVEAIDMLWRRETHQVGSNLRYNPLQITGLNTVLIEEIKNFQQIEVILYTKIPSNIDKLTPKTLANLAAESACSEVGKKGNDGISYLINAKRNGIQTPLMSDYEKEILKKTITKSLEEAWKKVSSKTE